MQFTSAQEEAIGYREGHLQIIACAGSGKTEVVAQRIAQLLLPSTDLGGQPQLTPQNIVAFTFTEKAAAELKERITKRVHEVVGNLPGMAEMYVGTIHGFCLELLRTEVSALLKYEVLNEVQQTLLIDRYAELSGLTSTKDLQGKSLSPLTDIGMYVKALDVLRNAKLVETQLSGNTAVAGLQKYRALLDEKNYFDYTAILEQANRILETDRAVRARLAARVRHVIVDEYQDTNPIQERLVATFASLGAQLCVVGDDDQTLYQWNGADVRQIVTFAKRYPNTHTVTLQENFRSSRAIVELARDFIAQNQHRLEKAMQPTDQQPVDPGDVTALTLRDPSEEAAYIARTITSLRGVSFTENGRTRGLAYGDMAILIRANLKQNAAEITEALTSAGIPFLVQGMNTLFDTREVQAARTLFYFIANKERVDAGSLTKTLNHASLGSTPEAIERTIALAQRTRDELAVAEQTQWNTYGLQRVFLSLLESLELREDAVPNERGEVVFYNLGQFSQLISDFETIHYHSAPLEKYEAFAKFLRHGAVNEYAEGLQANPYASPDAVRIMTMHRAKGLQWPVVFLPGMMRGRFPSSWRGSKTAWEIIPERGVVDAARYHGDLEDERRLFYVAMTRAQKFLLVSCAPVANFRQSESPSPFFEWLKLSKHVKKINKLFSERPRVPPRAKSSIANVTLTFSELKHFFECPYQFKLRVLYGFSAPIAEAQGYGKSLHSALAEIHQHAIDGTKLGPDAVGTLLQTHLHLPYASPSVQESLSTSGAKVLHAYLKNNEALLDQLVFAEKPIEVSLGGGVRVAGRIDMVYRRDSDELSIVDFKSNARSQAETVTETQLHLYALGYEELTGERADFVEIWELEEQRKKPRSVDDDFIAEVKARVKSVATALRDNEMTATPSPYKCGKCDYRAMCSKAV